MMKVNHCVGLFCVALSAVGSVACSGDHGKTGDDGSGNSATDTGSESGIFVTTDTGSGTESPSDTDMDTDTTIRRVDDKVYAHSAETLYAVDPEDLSLTTVGAFIWPEGDDQMTDIALNDRGNMVGVSFSRIYSVDKETAECTLLADFDGGSFNGLGFVEGVGGEAGATLIGATGSGGWYALDPETGAVGFVGSYGGAMGSSGDIVYIRDGGTYATVDHPDYTTDVLVSVDPDTGAATVIGETGFDDIWGVAYWAGQVFGFTDSGQFLIIDVTTGQGTLVRSENARFWGAGVTTLAPTIVV